MTTDVITPLLETWRARLAVQIRSAREATHHDLADEFNLRAYMVDLHIRELEAALVQAPQDPGYKAPLKQESNPGLKAALVQAEAPQHHSVERHLEEYDGDGVLVRASCRDCGYLFESRSPDGDGQRPGLPEEREGELAPARANERLSHIAGSEPADSHQTKTSGVQAEAHPPEAIEAENLAFRLSVDIRKRGNHTDVIAPFFRQVIHDANDTALTLHARISLLETQRDAFT